MPALGHSSIRLTTKWVFISRCFWSEFIQRIITLDLRAGLHFCTMLLLQLSAVLFRRPANVIGFSSS